MNRLMIIEDEDIIRRGLKEKIPWQNIGFTVVGEASDGEIACQMIHDLSSEVILTDIMMPVMDGIRYHSKKLEKVTLLNDERIVDDQSGIPNFR